MAIFHFTVTQTKRSKGQSAIASAAYRSGERLYSEYYGEYSDYTRKGGVICSDILLPSHAPKEYADRQTLWNAVEKAERGKTAQLAYSFEISLQNEFSLEENIALARKFLLELPEDGRIMFTEESGLNFVGGEKTIQQFLQESKKDRHTEEVEAESISYAVCKYYGIETSENSFGYIASWSQGKELKELRSSLETISKTSGELISDIDRHYKEICKERGIDLTAEQERVSESEKTEGKEPALSTSNVQQETLTYYVAECMEFPSLGEYHENLSLMEAVELYQAIPAERMNGIKGIGFDLQDGSDYNGQFPILIGKTIDVETINGIDHFRNSPLVQKAVSDLIAAMPDMEVTQAAPPLAELGIDQKVMGNVAELLQVQPSQESVAFDINGEEFLAIQHCESGHDYTIYSPDFALLDGGQIDNHSLEQVTYELLMEEIKGTDLVRPYDYDTLMEQVEAAQQQQFEKNELGEVQSPSVSMLPESPEQALDEYPMPDPVLTQDDLEKCGYLDSDLFPLSKERAYELMERDLTVYIVQEGETPEMAFDTIDWMPMTVSLLCPVRNGNKARSSMRRCWIVRSISRNESRRFYPMRETALLSIK